MKYYIVVAMIICLFSCTTNEKAILTEIPTEIPDGMVFIPSGTSTIGNEDGLLNERGSYEVKVKGFFMDIHPVTVGEFRAFINATQYKTQAENFGDGSVLNDTTKTWELRKGVTWEYPQGRKYPQASEDHPVTVVSWNDAQAYCQWAKKRLPTEIEWEHAAKNAKNVTTLFPWGDELEEKGIYKANFWQGSFPHFNEVKDKFAYTNPVGKFGKTPLGLTDMAGNVWEWCEDWYLPYDQRDQKFTPTKDSEKVQRGGSFLCDPSICYGFRTTARTHSTPESSLYHVGFRTVKDITAPN